ncbi:hypothetical protein ABW20_dc0103950 [Dactylellina cionopaga]|nr:hypothetical protein ABW20_dc0103950 [Dactylellina cionopaga]
MTTSSVLSTSTLTFYSTVTDVAHNTASATAFSTIETTLSGTTTVIDRIQGSPLTTSTLAADKKIKKRITEPSATSHAIPSYASWCSGAIRFTSACSCIGITSQRTITVPTPSTTITILQTTLFSVTTTVVQTTSITTTDTTSTQTVVDATRTVGAISTVLANKFLLKITFPATPTQAPRYIVWLPVSGGFTLAGSATQNNARQFQLDMSGGLSVYTNSQTPYMYQYYLFAADPLGPSGHATFFAQQARYSNEPKYSLLSCSIGTSYEVSCAYKGNPVLLGFYSNTYLDIVANQTVFDENPTTLRPITLSAVPVAP